MERKSQPPVQGRGFLDGWSRRGTQTKPTHAIFGRLSQYKSVALGGNSKYAQRKLEHTHTHTHTG